MTESLAMMTRRRKRVLWGPVGTRKPMTEKRIVMVEGIAIVTEATETDAETGTGIEIVDILGTIERKIDTGTNGLITIKRRIVHDQDQDLEIVRYLLSER